MGILSEAAQKAESDLTDHVNAAKTTLAAAQKALENLETALKGSVDKAISDIIPAPGAHGDE